MPADPTAHAVPLGAPVLSAPARDSPSPLRVPAREAEDVHLRLRLQRGAAWQVDDTASPWRAFELRLAPADEDRGTAPTAPTTPTADSLALGTPHGVLFLEDDTLLAIATGAHLPRGADGRMDEGLLRLACTTWPPALCRALGDAPTPLVAERGRRQAGLHAAVLTFVSRDGARQGVPIRASARTLRACATAPGWQAPPAPHPMPAAVAAIVLQVGLQLARVAMPAARLPTLRPGDAVWLPSDGRGESSPLCLVCGRQLVHLGQVDHLTREFQGWGSTGGAPSNSPHAFPPPTEPQNVDALTVDLDFIVGRVAMTVGELSALAAGQIIPLQALTPASVRIVAHGTELGAGQLVEVEGRLAVEILSWGSPR